MKAINFFAGLPSLKFQVYAPECKGVKDLIWTKSNLVKAEYLYRDGKLGEAVSAVNKARESVFEARKKRTLDEKGWEGYKKDIMDMKEVMLEKRTPKVVYDLNKRITERLIDEIIRNAVEFCAAPI